MRQVSTKELLDNLFDGVYYVDLNRKVSFWNKAAEKISGYKKEDVIGTFCYNNILRHIDGDGNELCNEGCPLKATLDDGKMRESSIYLHHKLGHRVPVHVRVTPIRDASGEIVGGVEIFTDNSSGLATLQSLEKYKEESYIDPLLEIGNRRYAEIVLQKRFYEMHDFGVPFSVLFFDLDDFKLINDEYGHAVGDDILRMVGKSTVNALRQPDTVIRWGGDEFLVILPNVDALALEEIVNRILVSIKHSFIMLGEKKLTVNVSMGATVVTAADTNETLIERVDQLMYQSKHAGKRKVTIG
jgi:diguanylate cyclase (GGDEF)-like protein/PAS domain S-box-containing protein